MACLGIATHGTKYKVGTKCTPATMVAVSCTTDNMGRSWGSRESEVHKCADSDNTMTAYGAPVYAENTLTFLMCGDNDPAFALFETAHLASNAKDKILFIEETTTDGKKLYTPFSIGGIERVTRGSSATGFWDLEVKMTPTELGKATCAGLSYQG